MPHIQTNHGLLTILAKQWHSKHNTFHFPIGEVTINLEDVYCILQVPYHGDLMSSNFDCCFAFSGFDIYVRVLMQGLIFCHRYTSDVGDVLRCHQFRSSSKLGATH